jgi:hypothetical protein
MAVTFTTEKRWNIVAECCLRSDLSCKLTRIDITAISSLLSVSEAIVKREWKSFKDQRQGRSPEGNISLEHIKHAGGSISHLNQGEFEAVHAINEENEGYISVRDMLINLQEIYSINITQGALERHLKLLGSHYIHSRTLPHLTEAQMMARLKFCVDRIEISEEGHLIFVPFQNTLWLDEKWFDMFEKSMIQLLLTGSSDFPKRHPDKNALQKVMFVAFLGQPARGIDGKYGMWAFTDQQPAKRRSKRREAGTMETKCVSVTADVFYEKCVEPGGLLDSLVGKIGNYRQVEVLMDNAKPHIGHLNVDKLNTECRKRKLRVIFKTQPANSPDLNLCDASFFHALNSRVNKLKMQAHTIDDFIALVLSEFETFPVAALQNAIDHIYANMNGILLTQGGNEMEYRHFQVAGVENDETFSNSVCMSACQIDRLRAMLDEYYE